jgi:hypothetical protein
MRLSSPAALLTCCTCRAVEAVDLQRVVIERRFPGVAFTALPWRCVDCGSGDIDAAIIRRAPLP